MDRIYKYNPDAIYKPNGGTDLQIMSAKDLYIQKITVVEHNGHSDSFQVKFPNVFTNYPLGAVRVEDLRFKDWDYYKFTIWQLQLNFVVFCASSACGVSVEHLNAKEINDKEHISLSCLLSHQKDIKDTRNPTAR